MNDKTQNAVILARGLGTRMRKADDTAILGTEQSAAADAGIKAMIPIKRPFLDYVLSGLADAGFTRVCLVIGPEHDAVRQYYSTVDASRLSIEIAIQEKPLGTADAVLAAEEFAGKEPFGVFNSDNYYPVTALRALRTTEAPAMIAFSRRALIEGGNFPVERLGRFGALDIDEEGLLRKIVRETNGSDDVYASMNCWLFTKEIFDACRRVPLSARGELELPKAVELAIREQGMRVRAVRVDAPVLDMSSRGDIASVAARLENVEVAL
jgi:glucose-1-phosphate thymidylyltransferase